MQTLDKQELRRLTGEAVKAALSTTAQKAHTIFSNAMDHLAVEMAAGRNYAVVMSLKSGDDYTLPIGAGKQICRSEWLGGVAGRVFHMCAVFDPTLEYWSRTEGHQRDEYIVEGFNIVLHWKNPEDLLQRVKTLEDQTLVAKIQAAILKISQVIDDKARKILSELKTRATLQAQAGKDWTIVMSLRAGTDYEIPKGHKGNVLEPDWLHAVPRAVWEACQDYAPTLEYWSRMVGSQRDEYEESGFNLIIHW